MTSATRALPGLAAPSQRKRSSKSARAWAPYAFLIPFLVLFLGFFVAPIVYAFYLSLFVDRQIGGNVFVGLANYAQVIADSAFWSGAARVGIYAIIEVPLTIVLATVLALLLDSGRVRGVAGFQVIFFLPFAIPSVVSALLWGYMYGTNFGVLTQMARAIGLGNPGFLTPAGILPSIMNIALWATAGANMVILYSAVKSISPDLYEAARLDGASEWSVVWNIKIPLLRPTLDLHHRARHHRGAAAVQRAADPAGERARRDLVIIHPERLRVRTRKPRPVQLRRCHLFHARRRNSCHHRRRSRYLSKGASVMTVATTRSRTPRVRSHTAPQSRTSVVLMIVAIIALAYFLLPLAWMVIASTKSNADLFSTFGLVFGNHFDLWSNIRQISTFDGGVFFQWLGNTFFYSVTSAVAAAVVSTLAGYALSIYRFRGRGTILGVILVSVAVPVTILIVPLFLLLSAIHLVNTPLAIILPSAVSPFGVYLLWVFAGESLPVELIEAARVDGAGELRAFRSVAFPLLSPGFVTVLLFSFVATWNNYLLPLLVFSDAQEFPLTVGLGNWNAQATAPIGAGTVATFNMVITGSLISVIPLLVLFLFLQRYWRQGLTFGSVKG